MKVKDLYDPDADYLIEWFFSEYVGQGFNGPMRLPIIDFPNFDSWITGAFKFLYALLLEDSKSSP